MRAIIQRSREAFHSAPEEEYRTPLNENVVSKRYDKKLKNTNYNRKSCNVPNVNLFKHKFAVWGIVYLCEFRKNGPFGVQKAQSGRLNDPSQL